MYYIILLKDEKHQSKTPRYHHGYLHIKNLKFQPIKLFGKKQHPHSDVTMQNIEVSHKTGIKLVLPSLKKERKVSSIVI